MLKKYAFLITVVLSMILLSGCFMMPEENEKNGTSAGNATPGRLSMEEDTEVKNTLLETGAVREPQVQLKGDGSDQVTVLVYMNGSNLESESGEATEDLTEMVQAGSSDQVNVLVQTMGTRSWQKKYAIASDRSQIYRVDGNGLTLEKDDLGQQDCTEASTLTQFIEYGVSAYPADRYILLFWDHGGGPVYGFGYDEWNSDETASLRVDEMQQALSDAGVYFDFIGMDCCIMSSLETCCALYDYCDYTVLSEDFESGLGWHYTDWMKTLYANPSIPTTELGAQICDEVVNANEADKQDGDESIMALIDESMMKVLYTAWTDFAYANEDSLLQENYSEELNMKAGGRYLPALRTGDGPLSRKRVRTVRTGDGPLSRKGVRTREGTLSGNESKTESLQSKLSRMFGDEAGGWNGWNDWYEAADVSMADYYVTDIMAVAQNITSEESDALSAALNQTLLYVSSTEGDASLTGLSVTLPYGDADFYQDCKAVFTNIGLDSTYVDWLEAFANVSDSTQSYDYSDWNDEWNGWDQYDDSFNWNDWDYYEDEGYWEEGPGYDDFSYGGYDPWYSDYGGPGGGMGGPGGRIGW